MSERATKQGEERRPRTCGVRKLELYLIEAGWWPVTRGGAAWRHKAAHWAWPFFMAVSVTREAKQGGTEWIHRALRGEEVA